MTGVITLHADGATRVLARLSRTPRSGKLAPGLLVGMREPQNRRLIEMLT